MELKAINPVVYNLICDLQEAARRVIDDFKTQSGVAVKLENALSIDGYGEQNDTKFRWLVD